MGTSSTKAQHNTPVIWKDGKVVVNSDHQYYTQIQTQMLCCDVQFGYLVIYTCAKEDNVRYFKVDRDASMIEKLIHKAMVFYKHVIFSELSSSAINVM